MGKRAVTYQNNVKQLALNLLFTKVTKFTLKWRQVPMLRIIPLVLFSLLVSFSSYSKTNSLHNYCKKTFQDRENSKVATRNNGLFYSSQRMQGSNKSHNKMVFFRGCRYDTPWLEETYNTLCDGKKVRKKSTKRQVKLNEIKIPKYFLFLFDGAGDFNAEYANEILPIVNLDGSEGNDLGIGNLQGFNHLVKMHTPEEPLNSKEHELEIHYHPGSGLHQRENYASAIACARDIKNTLNILESDTLNLPQDSKWIVMGYSNGGALAINFQNDITDIKVEMDLAITIDPIVQAFLYPFHKFKNTIGKRNRKTKRFYNVYQNTDNGTLPLLSLRGKPVMNADINELVPTQGTILNKTGHENHQLIINTNAVHIATSCELAKIFDTKKRNFCD